MFRFQNLFWFGNISFVLKTGTAVCTGGVFLRTDVHQQLVRTKDQRQFGSKNQETKACLQKNNSMTKYLQWERRSCRTPGKACCPLGTGNTKRDSFLTEKNMTQEPDAMFCLRRTLARMLFWPNSNQHHWMQSRRARQRRTKNQKHDCLLELHKTICNASWEEEQMHPSSPTNLDARVASYFISAAVRLLLRKIAGCWTSRPAGDL